MGTNLANAGQPRNYQFSYKHDFNTNPANQYSGFRQYDDLVTAIDMRVWSPIVFKDGIRAEKNFLFADWAVFDFDEHRDIEQTKKELCDFINIIAPTKSHTDTHHRFRVCIPFARSITCIREYKHNMQKLTKEMGADPACKDAARFFWPSKFVYDVNEEGALLEVEKPPIQRVFEPTKLLRPSEGRMTDRLCKTIEKGFSQGFRDIGMFGLAKDLYREGFSWEEVERILHNVRTNPQVDANFIAKKIKSAKDSIEKDG